MRLSLLSLNAAVKIKYRFRHLHIYIPNLVSKEEEIKAEVYCNLFFPFRNN